MRERKSIPKYVMKEEIKKMIKWQKEYFKNCTGTKLDLSKFLF